MSKVRCRCEGCNTTQYVSRDSRPKKCVKCGRQFVLEFDDSPGEHAMVTRAASADSDSSGDWLSPSSDSILERFLAAQSDANQQAKSALAKREKQHFRLQLWSYTLLMLLAAVLIGGVGFGVYFWQENARLSVAAQTNGDRLSGTDGRIADLEVQLSAASAEAADLLKQLTESQQQAKDQQQKIAELSAEILKMPLRRFDLSEPKVGQKTN